MFKVQLDGMEPQVVTTVREVSALVGRKVTRADIMQKKVDGVRLAIFDDVEEVEEEIVEKKPLISNSESKLFNLPQEAIEEVASTVKTTPIVEESVDPVVDVDPVAEVEEVVEEPTVEVVAPVINHTEPVVEEVEETTPEVAPSTEVLDTKPQKGDSLETLMEKMKKLHASKGGSTPKKEKTTVSKIPFEGEFPELGSIAEESDIKNFFKQLTNEDIDRWLDLEGWTSEVNTCEHAGINRMRKCMLITNKFFPKEPSKSKKKKAKYAHYSTEQLMEMCLENDLEVNDSGDMRILRMNLIMVLRNNGLID